MNWLKQNWTRVVIIILMLVALGHQPYGYYQLLRWATSICSFYLAYSAHQDKRSNWSWTFCIIGILFNPIAPFYLDRETWQVLNISVSILYFVSLFKLKLSNKV